MAFLLFLWLFTFSFGLAMSLVQHLFFLPIISAFVYLCCLIFRVWNPENGPVGPARRSYYFDVLRLVVFTRTPFIIFSAITSFPFSPLPISLGDFPTFVAFIIATVRAAKRAFNPSLPAQQIPLPFLQPHVMVSPPVSVDSHQLPGVQTFVVPCDTLPGWAFLYYKGGSNSENSDSASSGSLFFSGLCISPIGQSIPFGALMENPQFSHFIANMDLLDSQFRNSTTT